MSHQYHDELERIQQTKDFLSHQNTAYRLMWNRIDVLPPPGAHGEGFITGIADTATLLENQGGYHQQERMVRDKRRSLEKALLYSYQAAVVRKCTTSDNEEEDTMQEVFSEENPSDDMSMVRALINPNKLKADYDEKIISTGFENNFSSGDVFEWVNTGTYWIIYLQELTELAYFRGNCRRCQYEISWEDEEGTHSTYVSVRGPVETKIDYIQKHLISVDNPNYSLNIYIPKNSETLKFFKRYAKFYLRDLMENEDDVCWRIEAVDTISTPGIIEVNAVEYYKDKDNDDLENGIANGLRIDREAAVAEEIKSSCIKGEDFIKPKKTYTYDFIGLDSTYSWTIDKKYPVEIISQNNKQIQLKWTATYSGQFILQYGDYSRTVVVQSLF